VNSDRIAVGDDIELDVVSAGVPGDPVVVLLHGFPESSYSWRHQVAPLAAAGFHVLAPNQRGYAGSSAPADVAQYSADHLVNDVCGLLDGVDAPNAVIVGHDWGALVAWHMGLTRPDRCRAIFAASVPFTQWPVPPTDVFKMIHGDRFFYALYFQNVGIPEAELDGDPERFLRSIYWVATGESSHVPRTSDLPAEGTGLIEAFEHQLGRRPTDLPLWLTPTDLDTFVAQFTQSGFFGPLSWYRNFDTNYHGTKAIPVDVLSMPTAFIAGATDPVIAGRTNLVAELADLLPNHLDSTLIDGVGHWVQQEAPERFNEWLLAMLNDV
jgi:pimeloyl-ACP methyl ester carboxylesterase